MLVLLRDSDDCVVARNASAWDRVGARLAANRLDHELAAGSSPEASTPLALRARILVRPQTRAVLAQSLQRLLNESTRPRPRLTFGPVTVRRSHIRAAADELGLLIRLLQRPAPVAAQGVAQVHVLLTDGGGPLYFPAGTGQLRDEAHRAALALEPLDHF